MANSAAKINVHNQADFDGNRQAGGSRRKNRSRHNVKMPT